MVMPPTSYITYLPFTTVRSRPLVTVGISTEYSTFLWNFNIAQLLIISLAFMDSYSLLRYEFSSAVMHNDILGFFNHVILIRGMSYLRSTY
jgi:hypothetical protein